LHARSKKKGTLEALAQGGIRFYLQEGHEGHLAPVGRAANQGALATARNAIHAEHVRAVGSPIDGQLVACRASEAPVRVGWELAAVEVVVHVPLYFV
jgi:hypothetical protein